MAVVKRIQFSNYLLLKIEKLLPVVEFQMSQNQRNLNISPVREKGS
jgi:hypothetical protein